MPRQKNKVDVLEVEEIINLKIKELGGMKSKLTYNNVWNFNKELVKNNVKRSNGKPFNLYGYTFWASSYNGEDYEGKAKIDKVKNSDDVILAGENFTKDVQDILILVDKYKNKPQELSRKLVKLFEGDKKKIESLNEQNRKLNDEIIKLRDSLTKFEKGFATMFYNSIYTDNSLNDVLSLKRSGDEYVAEELKNMFNRDEDKISNILSPKTDNDDKITKVLDMQAKAKSKKKLEELFPE